MQQELKTRKHSWNKNGNNFNSASESVECNLIWLWWKRFSACRIMLGHDANALWI